MSLPVWGTVLVALGFLVGAVALGLFSERTVTRVRLKPRAPGRATDRKPVDRFLLW